ncbi:MAG: MFS transporter [Anaerolineae bacterium]
MNFKLPPYPRAFWLLLCFFFVSRVGASLIWPFITVFIREQTAAPAVTIALLQHQPLFAYWFGTGGSVFLLPTPLASITFLLSLQAIATLAGTSVIGALMDRYGRKRLMVVGLIGFSVVLLLLSRANTLAQWTLLLPLYGIMQPIFYAGTNVMTADLVTAEQRTSAFALVRTIGNLAIAVGPAIGGIFIAHNRDIAYVVPALLNLSLVIPVALFLRETLTTKQASGVQDGRGFSHMLRDRPYMVFISAFALVEIAVAMVFMLLADYMKQNYQIGEDRFSLLLTINASMVVLLQYGVTRFTRRYPPLRVIAGGALFYVAGLSIYGIAGALPHFMLGMFIMTLGELIIMPTSSSLAANMAPPDMRARYLGIYSVTYTIGGGVGPLIGGLLAANFGPSFIWFGGAFVAFMAVVGFTMLARGQAAKAEVQSGVEGVRLVEHTTSS